MKTHWAWLLMLPMLAWLAPAATTRAQSYGPPPYGMGGGMIPPGAGYAAPAQHYDQGPVGGAVYGGEAYGEGRYYGDEYGGEGQGGFSAVGNCALGILRFIGPNPNGGVCAPRWYDLRLEYMSLERERSDGGLGLVSDGPAGLGDPLIILNTNSADIDTASGVRFTANVMLGAAGHLEFTYMGGFNWSGQAAVTDFPFEDTLYSVFSDFGNTPPPSAIQVPFDSDFDLVVVNRGGFTDTDAAEFADVQHSGQLYSFDLGYRRRWQGMNCRFQGSWLIGTRFMRLSEEFLHRTRVNYENPSFFVPIVENPGPQPLLDPITGGMDYFVGTSNNMTGIQVGGDVWVTLIPGIRLGMDLKTGVYGNRATQVTSIQADQLVLPVQEKADEDRATFHLELGLLGEYRLTEYFTITGGVYGMHFDGVALADENFNAQSPFLGAARDVDVARNSELFLYGATLGLQYNW